MLVGAGLLKPLGHPARNSTKFFATEILEQLCHDEKWLARASDAISGYWRGTQRPQAKSLRARVRQSRNVITTPKLIGRLYRDMVGVGAMGQSRLPHFDFRSFPTKAV